MMMFSLRPSRSSFAPRIAASVRTHVVSWNDAAEMKLCVVRFAFVMPNNNGSAVAAFTFFGGTAGSLKKRGTRLSPDPPFCTLQSAI